MKYPNVGVEVATTFPLASVDSRELIAVFPSVSVELNVFVPVDILFVYVFGIVVDAAMYELIALFCVVESIVRTPPVFVRPVPSSGVNVEPPSVRFVVEAVVNDPYVVDE